MKRCLSLLTLTIATLASAEPPVSEAPAREPDTVAAEALVQKELLKPLAAKEQQRSRFSRARLPALARRVRILDAQPRKDKEGGAFVSFAVDARHGYTLLDADETTNDGWRKDTITGCVYPGSGEVFVLRGDVYRPAVVMLGKKTKAAAEHICHGEPTQLASAK